jgi:autotransporter passenger strand-loop-strand repeat protein
LPTNLIASKTSSGIIVAPGNSLTSGGLLTVAAGGTASGTVMDGSENVLGRDNGAAVRGSPGCCGPWR